MKNTIRIISKPKDSKEFFTQEFKHNQPVLQAHIDVAFRKSFGFTTSLVLIINEDIDKTIDNGTRPALKLVS